MNLSKNIIQQVPDKTIFVANIPYDANEKSIHEFFESFNLAVKSVRMVLDRTTGKSRGIAYVEFYDEISAHNSVLEANDKELYGRQIKVTAYDPNFSNRSNDDRYSSTFSEKIITPESDQDTFKTFTNQPLGKDLAIYFDSHIRAILGHTDFYEPDKLTEVIAEVSRDQLFNMLMLVKLLDQKDNCKTRNLLMRYPLILRVLFQAEIMFGLIRTNMLLFSQIDSVYFFTSNLMKNNSVGSFSTFKTSSGYVVSPTTPFNDKCSVSKSSVQNWGSKPLYKPLTQVTNKAILAPTHQHALNVIINMTHAQIAQLPDEKRRAVLQIRRQLRIPPFDSL